MMEIDFKITYFVSPSSPVRDYLDTSEKYFNQGETVTIYVDNADLDYTTEESQNKLKAFNEKYKSCDGCQKKWTLPDSFKSWYDTFRSYAKGGSSSCSGAYDSAKDIIEPSKFMDCLTQFLSSRGGRSEAGNIVFSTTGTKKIIGFRQSIILIYINSAATDGVKVLQDLRKIEEDSGLQRTFSFT